MSFALALLAAGPASALSCARPTVETSFRNALARDASYVVALGALTRTGPDIPRGSNNSRFSIGHSYEAFFEGRFAGRDGFHTERSFPVTVEILCVSAWCGGNIESAYGLFFFREDGDGYALDLGPCPLFFFHEPVEHQLMEVIGLLN